jgi:hypothetical protein
MLRIQTAIGDVSARPSERRRVDCFLRALSACCWPTISGSDDAFLELISIIIIGDLILEKRERKMADFHCMSNHMSFQIPALDDSIPMKIRIRPRILP